MLGATTNAQAVQQRAKAMAADVVAALLDAIEIADVLLSSSSGAARWHPLSALPFAKPSRAGQPQVGALDPALSQMCALPIAV